jgi:probable phosphoglycerate mutase
MRHGDVRQDPIKRYIGQADLSLNSTGRLQAAAWRDELAQVPFTKIFCSDLSRSFETAAIIAAERTPSVQTLQRLREINLGAWDGQPIADVRAMYPGEYEKRGTDLAYYRPPAGECFADVAARVIPLFEEIVRNVQGNLLIVGHGGVNKVILSHLLGMPLVNLLRLRQDYGCLNLIEYRQEALTIRSMNIQPPCAVPAVLAG